MEVDLHAFLISALDGGEWSVSWLLYPQGRRYWIGGWVGPRAGLDTVEPLPGLETPIIQPVTGSSCKEC